MLWDNHLAAVASDSPALEALPKTAGNEMEFLHFHMLAFFGMPIRRDVEPRRPGGRLRVGRQTTISS